MATEILHAPTGATSSFNSLQTRMLGLLQHFRLADQQLTDNIAELPDEYQPAASVLHSATASLDELYDELDAWAVGHDHTPRRPVPDGTQDSVPAILARLDWMRRMAETLREEIDALRGALPEDAETDGDSAREPLAELRIVLGEVARDVTSAVNYLTPLPNQEGDCAIYALQQLIRGAQ